MNPTPLSENLGRIQRTALMVGVVGSLALLIGAFTSADQFFSSYMTAFLFWLGPTLGSLAIVMLHNMTGGAWGFAIRRLLEAGMRNVPLMGLLFVPILLFGIGHLYEWSHADVVAADAILQHKAAYLNRPFFTIRAVAYFAAWAFLAFAMVRLQARYDRHLEIGALRQMKSISGLGLVIYVLTMSFAAFDWGMSMEPHWFSTIYGLIFVVGQGLATLCLAVVVASRLARHEPFSRWFEPRHFHDLGNLVMAFVMLWAYMSFSQFLIIWSGNLPEEAPWYLHRIGHGWQALALLLVAFHFAVPFLVLLNRPAKRKMGVLAVICAGIFVMRYAELFWLIAPAGGAPFHISWMDVVAPIALGGLWISFFIRGLRGRPLVSLQDAKLLGKLEEAPIL
ncbi:MAG TPA: hypothetical protein ENJ09_13200 [Planctomycetes bacterium]|nr:hypothetical protein [Planctomycetota bacterium]